MKRFVVTIEEHISQAFEVEADNIEGQGNHQVERFDE